MIRASQLNSLLCSDHSKVKLSTILASAGAVFGASGQADAVDIFYSGPITSNNVVGFNPTPGSTVSTYAIQLKSRNAAINANVNGTFSKRVIMAPGTSASFKAARAGFISYMGPAAQTFGAGATWAARAAGSGSFGNIVRIYKTTNTYLGRPASSTVSNKYLLFKFTDTADDYYGWIDIDYINTGTSMANVNQSVTVKSYAWQKGTLGILAAGVVPTAVPEPSTLITSGIAALAGGAVALRRWRRERKASLGAA